ncbi:MAG: hypothetical protein WKF77_05935, partial [Planctomycetaceae bacterium]
MMTNRQNGPNTGTGANATASQAGAAGLEAAIRLAWITDRQLPFNPNTVQLFITTVWAKVFVNG